MKTWQMYSFLGLFLVNLHLYTRLQWFMPLFDEMNESLQRERGNGMHHISKSIYKFATNKSYRFVFSVPKSIRKIYWHVSVWDGCSGEEIPNSSPSSFPSSSFSPLPLHAFALHWKSIVFCIHSPSLWITWRPKMCRYSTNFVELSSRDIDILEIVQH